MATAKVVIGANFGDEGKGLMTDFLASQEPSLNVLFNGGSQRGHTVVTPEGARHVFHHFGSGTFAGAETLLSHHFISNPVMFKREYAELESENPIVFADPSGPLTTPLDMAINQILEESRGVNRHGSCGVGINETLQRHACFPIFLGDLLDETHLMHKLQTIQHDWVFDRLKDMGVEDPGPKWTKILTSEHLLKNFLADCAFLKSKVTLISEYYLMSQASNVIFEAGQGLLLDEDHAYFPHVTHSKTGLANVLQLADKAGLGDLDVYYMTRWYATRHGAGPFESELESKPSPLIEDHTNIPNPFQGTLRFGLLDLDLLGRTIKNDIAENPKVNASVVVTCMDQGEDFIPFVQGTFPWGKRGWTSVKKPEAAFFIEKGVGLPVSHTSYGPTRATMSTLVGA